MSAAIKDALRNLDQAIDRAEGSLIRHQKSLKAPRAAKSGQPDLFAPAAVASQGLGFDRNMLARKLDMTITRVEQLLGEV